MGFLKSYAVIRNFIIGFVFLCPIILPAFPFEVFTHHLYIWVFRGILQQFTAYLTAEQDTLGKKRKKERHTMITDLIVSHLLSITQHICFGVVLI